MIGQLSGKFVLIEIGMQVGQNSMARSYALNEVEGVGDIEMGRVRVVP